MIRGSATLILIFFSLMSFGQLSVAVSASSDTINFGDEVLLTYKLNIPEGVDVTSLDFTPLKECLNLVHDQSPTELDSIMDVDVLDGGPFKIDNNNLIVTKDKLNGVIPISGTIRARVSSIGVLDLPRPILGHLSGVKEMLLGSPRLFVKPLGAMEDINPNWNIIEEEISWRDYLKYLYILLGLAALGAAIYFVRPYLKKEKEVIVIEVPEEKPPADVIALKDLDILKSKELWQNGDTKGYHTELTRIMRQYIEDRYEIQALEMTSSQLKKEMNLKVMNSSIVSRFDDILQIADKVKFAKGDAGPEINIQFMEEAYNIVAETKEIKILKDVEK